ncbi:MAG: class I SAM-dependent DNA methyltransferase [Cypionkella sp.]
MTINANEWRARAAAFSEKHKAAHYEKGHTQTFYNDFFAIFGVDRGQVAVYEQRVRNLPKNKQGFIDLYMPGTLIVEQKSAGLDLRKANDQALDYYEALPAGEKPRYILTCDFQRWELLDLEKGGPPTTFTLPELKRHITRFAFITGNEVRQFKNQKPVNPKATALLSRLHRQLAEDGYTGHKLQLLLVRLLFCLFADDTGIWERDKLWLDLQERTRPDGSDLGAFITQLFEVLNTPDGRNGTTNDRQASLPEHLREYPYINGRLFEEPIGTATFNNALRDILIDASAFDWGSVSPAIFGALFEGVIDSVTRRAQGAHYTPEEAIFRVIGPLFLEQLHDEFERLKATSKGDRRTAALNAFHEKLATLTFFDPACGAGNFLVVTYRELRDLERQVIEELHPPGTRLALGASEISKVSVEQFYGIEIDEFPSQIAQVALWMTDHIANVNLGDAYGEHIPSIPLVHAPHIRHADALEIDWNKVLPAERCSYVFGNPPFVGAKMQSAEQRAQVRRIAKLGGSGGTLDYVAAWFLKAGDYVQGGEAKIAFVATNSITQGEQVAQLWPKLFNERRLEIAFGHRTFVWPGRAAVHCVIVGLAQRGSESKEKRLFSYPVPKGEPVETQHEWLTAYLFGSSEGERFGTVKSESKPLSAPGPLSIGSQIIDDGFLTFLPAERSAFLLAEPSTERFFARLIGADELINGTVRFVLNLRDAPAGELRRSPGITERVRRVRAFREKSKRKSTLAAANHPHRFALEQIPRAPFLVLPRVSSERRDYMPIAWEEPPAIPTDAVIVKLEATLYDFAILTSAMHMAWLRQIGGRLESRYRYSIGLVYNTFPWPEAGPGQRGKIEALAQAVLDARALDKNASSTLADLYDPDFMPPELRRAHRELDAAVDRLYNPRGFADERARVEHLFRLYERLVQPTAAAPAANRRTNRRVARSTAPAKSRPL